MKKRSSQPRISTRQARTPVLHFRLARPLHSALKIRAAHEHRPMYRVLEAAVTEYLARHSGSDGIR